MSNRKSSTNNCSGNSSGKLTIIDQDTYEQFHQESNTTHKIKNIKFKKSQQVINLAQFIKSKTKKKRLKRTVYAIYKKRKHTVKIYKRRLSKLKKCILKNRIVKRSARGETDITKSQTDDVTECLEKLTLGAKKETELHSRRFREYCDNTTSNELCNLVETLLRELYRFQKRAFQCNKYKDRRRIVIGFREVRAQMKINKIKFVVIATDCETCPLEDGLDQTIMSIREDCRNKTIPCAFALHRRQLSYSLFKKSPVSCVGILDYDGAQDIFFKMLKVLDLEKINYKCFCQEKSNSVI